MWLETIPKFPLIQITLSQRVLKMRGLEDEDEDMCSWYPFRETQNQSFCVSWSADRGSVFLELNAHSEPNFQSQVLTPHVLVWSGLPVLFISLQETPLDPCFLSLPLLLLILYSFLLLSTSFYKANESEGGAVLLTVSRIWLIYRCL